jgi:hypothetical protein
VSPSLGGPGRTTWRTLVNCWPASARRWGCPIAWWKMLPASLARTRQRNLQCPSTCQNPPKPGDGTQARHSTTMKKSWKDRSLVADTERVWKKRNNPNKDSVYQGQSLYDIDKEERLVDATKSGSTFVEPLASQCLKFER